MVALEKMDAFVRCYAKPLNESSRNKKRKMAIIEKHYEKPKRILVLDTESTLSQIQTLKVGTFAVIDLDEKLNQSIVASGLFYNDNKDFVNASELESIKQFCKDKNLMLITRKQFIEDV